MLRKTTSWQCLLRVTRERKRSNSKLEFVNSKVEFKNCVIVCSSIGYVYENRRIGYE